MSWADLRTVLGLCGIAAAKFYLDVHPECRLVMLERDGYIGGVWNASEQPSDLDPDAPTCLSRVGEWLTRGLDDDYWWG